MREYFAVKHAKIPFTAFKNSKGMLTVLSFVKSHFKAEIPV